MFCPCQGEAKACTDSDTCVNQLKNLPQILDEQLLSAASEMYLAKTMALSDSSECKISRFTKHKPTEEQKLFKINMMKMLRSTVKSTR